MKYLTPLFLIFFYSGSFAQMASIHGKVFGPDEKGIASATILLIDSAGQRKEISASSADGSFYLNNIREGSYVLSTSFVGFNESRINFLVGGDTSMIIHMVRSDQTLKEVVVTSSKKVFEMKADKIVMNVEGNTLAVGNSVFDMIRKGPAMSADKDDNLLMKGITAAIFINGKQSFLSGGQLTEYLKNLPAETVSSIEFITNPGSKYPAEGTGGIINIRIKKNTLYGTNGQASLGLGYGRYPKYRSSVDLNYRNKKLNLFGGSSVSYSKSYNELTYNSRIVNNDQVSYQDRSNYWNPRTWWQTFKAGMDYTISNTSLIGFGFNLDLEQDTIVTTNNSIFSNQQKDTESMIRSLKGQRKSISSFGANLNYKKSFDSLGSEWSVDLDYSFYNGRDHSITNNEFLDRDQIKMRNDFVFFNQQPTRINLVSFKSDYSKIISSASKAEIGIKVTNVNSDNNLISDTLASGGWEPDHNVTNHFLLNETIAAAYATYTSSWKDMEIQIGLRSEHTTTKGNLKTLDLVSKRNYLDFFPTAFLRRKLNDNNELSLGFSRRISRPAYNNLNPFVNYVDPYTRFEGNPKLNAAYGNTIEMKHSYKSWLISSLSYTHVRDNIIRTILQDSVTKVIVNKTQNAGKLYAFRLDVLANFKYKCWSASAGFGIGYGHGVSSLKDYSYDTRSFSGDFTTTHSFSLPHNIRLMVDGYYSFPERIGIEQLKAAYSINMGIQKSFWNNKATIKLNGNTVFGRPQYRAHYLGSGLDIRWVNEWEGRRINLNFSYKFGNQKVKAPRKKSDALETEKGRVNL